LHDYIAALASTVTAPSSVRDCLDCHMASHKVKINRAPVLTLWAAVVAERLGFEWEEALTLGNKVKASTVRK